MQPIVKFDSFHDFCNYIEKAVVSEGYVRTFPLSTTPVSQLTSQKGGAGLRAFYFEDLETERSIRFQIYFQPARCKYSSPYIQVFRCFVSNDEFAGPSCLRVIKAHIETEHGLVKFYGTDLDPAIQDFMDRVNCLDDCVATADPERCWIRIDGEYIETGILIPNEMIRGSFQFDPDHDTEPTAAHSEKTGIQTQKEYLGMGRELRNIGCKMELLARMANGGSDD